MPGKYWLCPSCGSANELKVTIPNDQSAWLFCLSCEAEQAVNDEDVHEPRPRFTLDPSERHALGNCGNTIARLAREELGPVGAYALDSSDVAYVEEHAVRMGLDMNDPEVCRVVLDEVQAACNRWLARQRELTPQR